MLTAHRCLDNTLLQRLTILRINWFRAETIETEPAFQFLFRIMMFAAPPASRIGTGGIAQSSHDFTRQRKLVAHPGRHDRIAARYGKPGQGIGQRPAVAGCFGENWPGLSLASLVSQTEQDGSLRFMRGGLGLATQCCEKTIGATYGVILSGEPVPCREQFRIAFVEHLQCIVLIVEYLQRQLRILHRIIAMPALQPAVLIVFDQMVIGIAREGQRVQPEGIDGGFLVQTQIGAHRLEVGQVEFHQIMSQQECG